VGKPSSGKTTFFNAATLSNAKVASYPFTTIEPNVGIGYVSKECVCKEFGIKDHKPIKGFCLRGIYFAPIRLIDVAGLIPGARQGRGLGNQFLDHIRRAEALIHVVDIVGSTDIEGRQVPVGTHDPLEDVKFLEEELVRRVWSILNKDRRRLRTQLSATRSESQAADILYEKLSGLEITRNTIVDAINELGHPKARDEDKLLKFVRFILKKDKPMLIAGNKVDVDPDIAKENVKRLEKEGYKVVPTSALGERILKRMRNEGKIDYVPGTDHVEVLKPLDEREKRALELIEERVFKEFGSTGVQEALNKAAFDLLDLILVFPVEDPEKLTDHKGNVLPEGYLVKRGTTARELAYMIHSELGEKFVRAFLVRERRRVGADYVLKDRDVISIRASR